jgi:hypothetical protein
LFKTLQDVGEKRITTIIKEIQQYLTFFLSILVSTNTAVMATILRTQNIKNYKTYQMVVRIWSLTALPEPARFTFSGM